MSGQRLVHQYDPTVGYRFVPDLRARLDNDEAGYLLRTNGSGFRCEHEFVERKTPGITRILLFGDSFTAGDSVSNRDRYGDCLERLLPGIEVYNFGLSGSGTDQQYLVWREIGSRYEHDIVVLGVLVENVRRVAARFREAASRDGRRVVMAKPYFTLEDGKLVLHHVPVPRDPIAEDALSPAERGHVDHGGRFQWLRSAVTKLGGGAKDSIQRLTRYQPLPAYDDSGNSDWLLMKAILKQWVQEIRVPVVVCPIPLYQYVEGTASPEGYRARFGELEGWPRVVVHDPLSDFHRVPEVHRRQLRFQRDVHLTPEGHRILAESLARAISPLLARRNG